MKLGDLIDEVTSTSDITGLPTNLFGVPLMGHWWVRADKSLIMKLKHIFLEYLRKYFNTIQPQDNHIKRIAKDLMLWLGDNKEINEEIERILKKND